MTSTQWDNSVLTVEIDVQLMSASNPLETGDTKSKFLDVLNTEIIWLILYLARNSEFQLNKLSSNVFRFSCQDHCV